MVNQAKLMIFLWILSLLLGVIAMTMRGFAAGLLVMFGSIVVLSITAISLMAPDRGVIMLFKSLILVVVLLGMISFYCGDAFNGAWEFIFIDLPSLLGRALNHGGG